MPTLNKPHCQYCDSPGGERTLKNQVCMPINGRVQCIDFCIHHIVAALNAGGVLTVASCCGHGQMKGNIILDDGRVLIIQWTPESMDEWKGELGLLMVDTNATNNRGDDSMAIEMYELIENSGWGAGKLHKTLDEARRASDGTQAIDMLTFECSDDMVTLEFCNRELIETPDGGDVWPPEHSFKNADGRPRSP